MPSGIRGRERARIDHRAVVVGRQAELQRGHVALERIVMAHRRDLWPRQVDAHLPHHAPVADKARPRHLGELACPRHGADLLERMIHFVR